MQKKFIYFPSFSTKYHLLKRDDLKIGSLETIRFYDERFKQFQHPYFLLTAGEFYNKKENIRDAIGLKDSLVFGDSGGYQIATDTIKWKSMSAKERIDVREKIFHFLQNNSDVAMNLDIPPKKEWEGMFKECLITSTENIKYFYEHPQRNNKIDFLNVLQCDEKYEEYDLWYNEVKSFQFSGWSIGGTLKHFWNGVYALAILLENKEFEKKENKYLHFLGATNPFRFLFYATLQKNFNLHFPHVQVTTDSSTPALQGSRYDSWAHFYNTREWTFNYMKLGTYDPNAYADNEQLPCTIDCPICSNINWKLMREANNETAEVYASWHNLFITNKAVDDITKIAYSGSEITQGLVSNKERRMMTMIDEMFEGPIDAKEIFKREISTLSYLSTHHIIQEEEGTDR